MFRTSCAVAPPWLASAQRDSTRWRNVAQRAGTPCRRSSSATGSSWRCTEAVGAAIDGSGSLVYLEGRAGSGRRRCSPRRAPTPPAPGPSSSPPGRRARASALVRCGGAQLFETTLHDAQRDERTDLLSGAAGLASPLFDGAPAVTSGAPEEQLFQLLHGLYWLTSNLAERAPVVLAADDGHWTVPPRCAFCCTSPNGCPSCPSLSSSPPGRPSPARRPSCCGR